MKSCLFTNHHHVLQMLWTSGSIQSSQTFLLIVFWHQERDIISSYLVEEITQRRRGGRHWRSQRRKSSPLATGGKIRQKDEGGEEMRERQGGVEKGGGKWSGKGSEEGRENYLWGSDPPWVLISLLHPNAFLRLGFHHLHQLLPSGWKEELLLLRVNLGELELFGSLSQSTADQPQTQTFLVTAARESPGPILPEGLTWKRLPSVLLIQTAVLRGSLTWTVSQHVEVEKSQGVWSSSVGSVMDCFQEGRLLFNKGISSHILVHVGHTLRPALYPTRSRLTFS